MPNAECRMPKAESRKPNAECRIDMNMRRLHSGRRRGVAPLELVMAIPVIIGLVAVVFLVCDAGIAKLAACANAHADAWKVRRTQSSPAPLELKVGSADMATGRGTGKVSGMMGYRPYRSEAVVVVPVMGGTWDWRDLPMQGNPIDQDAMRRIARNRDMGSLGGLLNGLGGLMKVQELFNNLLNGAIDGIRNEEKKNEEKRKDMVTERDKLQAKLAILEARSRALDRRQQALNRVKDAGCRDKLSKAFAAIGPANEKPEDKQKREARRQKLNAAKNQLRALSNEYKGIKAPIDAKAKKDTDLEGPMPTPSPGGDPYAGWTPRAKAAVDDLVDDEIRGCVMGGGDAASLHDQSILTLLAIDDPSVTANVQGEINDERAWVKERIAYAKSGIAALNSQI